MVVDTEGLVWSVKVRLANEHESQRAFEVLQPASRKSDRLEAAFADRAYRGGLEGECARVLEIDLNITSSESEEPGFAVEPKRWIVERTFRWFGGWRRLSKEYERLTETSEAMVRLASLQVALNRLS